MTEATHSALREAIRGLHGCESTWREAVHVHETHAGQTVWDGEVQVFELISHPGATRCYAWSHSTERGKRRFVAVLHKPPVDSPVAAVRAAILDERFGK